MISLDQSVALSNQKNIWDVLGAITLERAVQSFVQDLTVNTKRNYISAFRQIFQVWEKRKLIYSTSTLQVLAHANIENLLDCIHHDMPGSVATKQSRCATFISFTRYLHRITGKAISVAIPKTGGDATFKKIRDKAKTEAITIEQWRKFLIELKKYSFRDYLIARAIFQGAKRCNEVLNALISDIQWDKKIIVYKQSKSNILEKNTFIHYPQEYLQELKIYLGDRIQGYIFISRKGNRITQPQIYRSFFEASRRSGLKINVHPHMLRASAITNLMKMGYHSDQIMKISGHSSPHMVLYYDKSNEEENISKEINFC